MYQNQQRQTAAQCPPPIGDPADQPKAPGGECGDKPVLTPPTMDEPTRCKPACDCPHEPPTPPTCLDDLIAQQAKEIAEAERAKIFKADLEATLAKAKLASGEYTQEKYAKLIEDWKNNDTKIAELVRTLHCAVPCWRCLIECFVCPLFEDVRVREAKLQGDSTLSGNIKNLYDLRYWHDRNLDAAKRHYERIRAVLATWEKPAQAIEKAIADCLSMINAAGKSLSPETGTKVVYDVFLKLVPLHLAIAPPASSGHVTRIGKEYTVFCECDVGTPDDCCGPDVGVPTLRQRLIGPQPYLVQPSDFFPILCCLTKERYLPAKDALSSAESAFAEVDAQIKRLTAEVDERMKPGAIEKAAKGAMPVGCTWWDDKPCEPTGRTSS